MTAAPTLNGQGLYRATCDPTPHVEPPAGAVELPWLRRKHSKSFLLPSGLHRQIITIGPQHYREGERWEEIHTELQSWQQGLWECRRTPYFFRNLPGRAGFSYKSREGGFATLRLVRVGGMDVPDGLPCEPRGNCLHYDGLALDADLHFQLLPAKVQAWATLHSEHAPREWEWEILHRPPVGVAINVRGWDAAGRPAEIVTERTTERLHNGLLRTRLVKRWTGAVWDRVPSTRARKRVEPVYPVVLDPDITEQIVADGDDGKESFNPSIPYKQWYAGGITFGYQNFGSPYHLYPGWRFQGIAVDQANTIDLATFKIRQTFASGSGGSGTMYCRDADTATVWANGSVQPTLVAKTAASVAFAPDTATGDKSLTVSTLVQEVIDRAGWASGNHLALFTLSTPSGGNNYCGFSDYPSSGNHGRLEIDYTAGGGEQTATAGVATVAVSAVAPAVSGSGTATTVPAAASVAVSAVDATGTPTTYTASPGVATVAVSAHDLSAAGSGTGTATPAVASVAVSAHDAAVTGSGSVSATPLVASVAVSAHDATAAGSGTGTATPDVATVAVSSHDVSASSGTVTGTALVASVAVSSHDTTGAGSGTATTTPAVASVAVSSHDSTATATGTVTVAPAVATVAVTGHNVSSAGSGTATTTPLVATVTVSSVDVTGSGSGSVSAVPGIATVAVSGHDATVSPAGSAPVTPLVATIAVTAVDVTAAGTGIGTATAGVATITVTAVDVGAEGGLLIPGPYYVDTAQTWSAGAVAHQVTAAGAVAFQVRGAGAVAAQTGVP